MTFIIDEEKRRTWNRGLLKRWRQGRVLTALCLIGLVSLVLMLPQHIRCFTEYLNLGRMPDGEAKEAAAVRDFIDMGILAVQVPLIACGVPVLGARRAPGSEFSSESLTVEDGWLRWTRLSNYSPDGKNYSLVATVCRLDACVFKLDEDSGMLKIKAGGKGSMGWALCDAPGAALTLPPESFEPAGSAPWPRETELYPYFEPDLIQYLRDQGVEVA